MNLNEKFKMKGLWHLPDSKGKEIGGVLKFIPKIDSKLELIGFLKEPKDTFLKPENGSYFEIIHGVLEDGEMVTLIDCFRRNYKANLRMKISTSTYRIRLILRGIHLEKRNLPIFTKASFEINVFPQWMKRNIINQTLHYINDEIDGFEFGYFKSKDQDTFTFNLGNETELLFKSFARFKEINFSGFELGSNFSIVVNSRNNNNFSFFLEKSNRFISFLRLCFSDCVCFTNFHLQLEPGIKEPYSNSWNKIIFKQQYLKKKTDRSLYMHVSYEDLQERINEIIVNWMKLERKYDPIIETLIKLNERGKDFTINDFLYITQCVDGFHRMEFNPSRTQFIHRIKKLISQFDYVQNLNFTEEDIQNIVDNRDYYTHLHLDKEVKLFSMPELYRRTRKLYYLVLFSLLAKVGFKDEMILKYSEDPYLY